MVPDPDLQLQMVIKALSETVSTAVDPDNKVAQEQLHLSIATLGMMRSRLPMTRRFYRALAQDALTLAKDLEEKTGQSGTLTQAMNDVGQALTDPGIENEAIEQSRARLHEAITDHLAQIDKSLGTVARDIVMQGSLGSIERQRAWFVESGFEPNADRIPAISELIQKPDHS